MLLVILYLPCPIRLLKLDVGGSRRTLGDPGGLQEGSWRLWDAPGGLWKALEAPGRTLGDSKRLLDALPGLRRHVALQKCHVMTYWTYWTSEVSFYDVFMTYWTSEVSSYNVFMTYWTSEVSFYDVFMTYWSSEVSFYDVFMTYWTSEV